MLTLRKRKSLKSACELPPEKPIKTIKEFRTNRKKKFMKIRTEINDIENVAIEKIINKGVVF